MRSNESRPRADRPLARVTLAVPPSTLEEWRRIASNGYTLENGTVVSAERPDSHGVRDRTPAAADGDRHHDGSNS